MNMSSTPSTESRTPNKPFQRGGIVVMGLAIGVGLAVARDVVPSVWPELGNPWAKILGIAVAAIVAGTVGLIVEGLLALLAGAKRSKLGINLQTVQCPECGESMPAFRKPEGISQLLWGGWTCQHCGCRMDKWGNGVEPKSQKN
jgi:hypothetical protein